MSTIADKYVPLRDAGLYREEATEAIFYLENVDQSLRDAPTVDGRVQVDKSDADDLLSLAFEVRRDTARLRELAESIELRVRAAGEVDA
jgi:hypothetical protein